MTVTDPVTPSGPESAGTTSVVSAAPAAPAVPNTSASTSSWPWLAARSLWAFVQAAGYGTTAAALTLYLWAVRAGRILILRPAGPLARFVGRRLAAAGRALGRWCWGRGRSGKRGKVSRKVWRRIRVAFWLLAGAGFWWAAWSLGIGDTGSQIRTALAVAALGFVPGLLRAVFALLAPRLYARFDAWTFRQGQRWWVRERWPVVAAACGLAVRDKDGNEHTAKIKTSAVPGVVTLRVPTLTGQTTRTILDAGEAIATDFGAHSFEVRPVKPGLVALRLFLTNALTTPRTAGVPSVVDLDAVTAGVRLDGAAFRLRVRGRHTLVVGASGSGKGSAFWGLVGGLAPAIPEGLVRVWGVDMKKGVEAGMGEPLFHAVAYTHADAVAILAELVKVIEHRGVEMRGKSRLHVPTSGDPLHVLVIDELADLMAYSDFEVRREAERLLSVILTQGRALGVVVAAFVQNPRQEAVGMRNLYTQKIALRLDSATEAEMVLDSRARTAPAELIDPDAPGTGYLVNEDGTVSLVRFDYWPDELIKATARAYPSPTTADLAPATPAPKPWGNPLAGLDGLDLDTPTTPRKRSPRKNPRNRRPADATTQAAPVDGSTGNTPSTEQETNS
ncbi:FtsK/SpoIIIE domain-containing protein [Myceligenerans xiligouense]|uniref:FtsK/SpoIIIE family protein n=1 Tax=Myceligenerans xiligouense TaxID=253184 RepID=A0A3N4ZC28_9MICO|nr:FtsK/SpoIIIE domain-containing protein [Myceligenerans xiligouense]RPF23428.1 FtsK/SpoIIIE family protein [Myceligenerans xiligouense]